MKNNASGFLKQIASIMTTAKAKTVALKSKTRAIKTRLIIFSLLRNKKMLMSTITDKLRGLTGQQQVEKFADELSHRSKGSIVLYSAMSQESLSNQTRTDSTQYSLFDDATDMEEFEDGKGSVIDMVKNSKPEGEEFKLENEIDHVADLFIQRFHRQMMMQKQLSFKRYQEMLERSA